MQLLQRVNKGRTLTSSAKDSDELFYVAGMVSKPVAVQPLLVEVGSGEINKASLKACEGCKNAQASLLDRPTKKGYCVGKIG